jgi:hypothetical protein
MNRDFSIIGDGLIGNLLHKDLKNSVIYDRGSSERFRKTEHDVVIIAAPSSNRLAVNTDPENDLNDCISVFNMISQSRYQNLVYISTVDIYPDKTSKDSRPVDCPKSGYGRNRWLFERMIMSLHDSQSIRLPTLCHPMIQKNIIFDLKNQVWLEKINPSATIQWYQLDRLSRDIEDILETDIKFENFVSPPLSNEEIIMRFSPELLMRTKSDNQMQEYHYDIKSSQCCYNIDIESIWQSMEKYFI